MPSRPGPTWTLLNQEGAPYGSANLRGKVTLLTFVYTHCPTACPLLTAQMKQLQDELEQDGAFGARVAFVSMTVDPQRDTPARLKEYAAQMGVDFGGWAWVTGESEQLGKVWQAYGVVAYVDLASLNTTTPTAHDQHSASNYEVIHSAKTVLLDGAGNMRAEYIGPELPLKRVAQEIRTLLAAAR